MAAERAALQLGFKGYADLEREEPFFDASTAVRTQQVAQCLLAACHCYCIPLHGQECDPVVENLSSGVMA